ncbi:PadR family transcriptional regulator [Agrilactobacillus yilanensis]|uniref:PadR family transcriptional regulator n=1 Tax=Agrilactobacillus yilanensis TaxID=2485997 RepID=A0ABW4J4B4_9LACO|nr:PadR family transcriptional regulator [Agrilactobacillus yilanensis]
MQAIDKELLRGYIDPIILSLLARDDSYGYDLTKQAHDQTEGFFELKEGTLYVALKRLEKAGYVTSYWQEGSGAARRKYYHLTVSGKAELTKKQAEWQLIKKMMDKFYGGNYDTNN